MWGPWLIILVKDQFWTWGWEDILELDTLFRMVSSAYLKELLIIPWIFHHDLCFAASFSRLHWWNCLQDFWWWQFLLKSSWCWQLPKLWADPMVQLYLVQRDDQKTLYVHAWMAFSNGLKTDIITNICCVFCNSSQEDVNHSFTSRVYSILIWDPITFKFGISMQGSNCMVDMLRDFMSKCDQCREGNMTLSKLCFPAFIWNVWQERNNRIIRAAEHPYQSILKTILYQIKTKASYLNLDCSASISASWDIPARTLACNQNTSEKINGSWNFFISSQDGFSVGFIFDNQGSIIWSKSVLDDCIFKDACTLILEASRDCNSLYICSDCKILREALNNASISPWRQRFQARKAVELVL